MSITGYTKAGADGAFAPLTVGGKGVVRKDELVFNVKDYGAAGNGTTDDTAAIQAAIDAAIGGSVAAGASTTRSARGVVWLPAGSYKITAPLEVYSVQGFALRGAGEETILKVFGNISTPLHIDGAFRGRFQDFTITGDAGATVTYGLQVEWITANAQRSTSGNVFGGISIRNLNFVYGFAFGFNSGSSQVDNQACYDCHVDGGFTAGNTTTYQAGFVSGSGTSGNILNHQFYNCHVYATRWAFYNNNVANGFAVVGGSVGGSEADFNLKSSGACQIRGIRSETSQRLLTSTFGAAYSNASLSDITFDGGSANADGQMIQWHFAGSLILDTVQFINMSNPCVYITNNAGPKLSSVLARGCASRTAAASFVQGPVSANAPFVARLEGYSQCDSSGQVTTFTPFTSYGMNSTPAAYTLGSIDVNGVLKAGGGYARGIATKTANYNMVATDSIILMNGSSLTCSLPDPTTVTPGLTFMVTNVHTSALTLNSQGTSKTINGFSSLSLGQNAGAEVYSDGAQWFTSGMPPANAVFSGFVRIGTALRVTDPATSTFSITDDTGGTNLVQISGAARKWFLKGALEIDGNSSGAGTTYLTVGNNSSASDALVELNPPTGQNATLAFKYAGANKWQFYTGNVSTSLFLRDLVNGVMSIELVPGSGTTGEARFAGIVKAPTFQTTSATPTFAAAQTLDMATAGVQYLTLTGNLTSLTFSNGRTDSVFEVHLIQDGTGSRTLSGAASGIKWAGGSAPTLTTTANRRDIFRFRYSGGNFYEISRSMNVG